MSAKALRQDRSIGWEEEEQDECRVWNFLPAGRKGLKGYELGGTLSDLCFRDYILAAG